MDSVRNWIQSSSYSAALGVEVESLSDRAARLRLPYNDDNSNPGQVLHGGCAASLAAIGAQAVSRVALGEDSGPWHTCALHVNYLSAAKNEVVFADVRLLRRGKELCMIDIAVETADGKAIAHAAATVRGRFAADAPTLTPSAGDHGEADPGVMGPHIGSIPFMGNRGIRVEHMASGTSRLTMPMSDKNGDSAGGIHEGAALALLDTTGAMAAWAETGPGRYKASTPALQAQIIAAPPNDDVVAYGRTVQRDNELLWANVELAGKSDGLVFARGTVVYRILT
jgi:uncharacterized protein (TIGR00369 family)